MHLGRNRRWVPLSLKIGQEKKITYLNLQLIGLHFRNYFARAHHDARPDFSRSTPPGSFTTCHLLNAITWSFNLKVSAGVRAGRQHEEYSFKVQINKVIRL